MARGGDADEPGDRSPRLLVAHGGLCGHMVKAAMRCAVMSAIVIGHGIDDGIGLERGRCRIEVAERWVAVLAPQ